MCKNYAGLVIFSHDMLNISCHILVVFIKKTQTKVLGFQLLNLQDIAAVEFWQTALKQIWFCFDYYSKILKYAERIPPSLLFEHITNLVYITCFKYRSRLRKHKGYLLLCMLE